MSSVLSSRHWRRHRLRLVVDLILSSAKTLSRRPFFGSSSAPPRVLSVSVVDILLLHLGVVSFRRRLTLGVFSPSSLLSSSRHDFISASSSSSSLSRLCLSVSVVGVFTPSSLYRRRYFNDVVAVSHRHVGVVLSSSSQYILSSSYSRCQ
jgi:hypothetical protein